MSRLLLGALAVLVLAAPAASAQTDATSSLTIQNLPAELAGNASVQFVPFDVLLEVEGLICLQSTGQLAVALTATTEETGASVGGNGTNVVAASFLEEQLSYSIGTQEALQGYSGSQRATLVLTVPPVAEGEREYAVNVTATLPPGGGGCANDVAGATATGTTLVRFGRDAALAQREDEKPQPGFALPLAFAALAAVAVALRRKA